MLLMMSIIVRNYSALIDVKKIGLSLYFLIVFLLNQGCKSSDKPFYDDNLKECERMVKEITVLMETYPKSGSGTIGFVLDGEFSENVIEVNDSLRSLSKMYERAIFISLYFNLSEKCHITDKPLNLHSILKKSDTTKLGFTFVEDAKFCKCYKELNNKRLLFITGKEEIDFKGHMYKAFKVKIECVYVGKMKKRIRNFGLIDTKGGLFREALCNVFVVTKIDKIEPTTIDGKKILP